MSPSRGVWENNLCPRSCNWTFQREKMWNLQWRLQSRWNSLIRTAKLTLCPFAMFTAQSHSANKDVKSGDNEVSTQNAPNHKKIELFTEYLYKLQNNSLSTRPTCCFYLIFYCLWFRKSGSHCSATCFRIQSLICLYFIISQIWSLCVFLWHQTQHEMGSEIH